MVFALCHCLLYSFLLLFAKVCGFGSHRHLHGAFVWHVCARLGICGHVTRHTLKNFMVIKLINMSNENFRSFYIHAESIHTCFKMFFVLFMSYILPHPGEVWGEGDTGPGCNAVSMINRRVLGIQHLYTHPVYLKTVVWKTVSCWNICDLEVNIQYMNLGDCYLIPAFLNLSFKWSSLLRTITG